MIIQINTDKTINGDERHADYYTSLVAEGLETYQSQITRIEVHLKDENGKKVGLNDKSCLLEARLEGKKPIAVTNQAGTIEEALTGAIDNLKTSLKTNLGRINNH